MPRKTGTGEYFYNKLYRRLGIYDTRGKALQDAGQYEAKGHKVRIVKQPKNKWAVYWYPGHPL